MIAAGVEDDVGVVVFGVAIFVALVLGVLIWNVVLLVVEEMKDRSQRKIASQVNNTSTEIVVNHD